MGNEFKGYKLVSCSVATWHDQLRSHKPLEYYSVDFTSPYNKKCAVVDFYKNMGIDLKEIFGEIEKIDLMETNRRAYATIKVSDQRVYKYNCFGFKARYNAKYDRWEMTLLLHEPFLEFPGGDEDEEDK